MGNLPRYGDWAPTGFDSRGAFLGEERADWIVGPCSQTRDSEALERSNYDAIIAALREVDPDVETWEEHRFGHWGPGWVEIAIAAPGSSAAGVLVELADRLSDYPVLDEDGLSELEEEDRAESWDAWGAAEFVRMVRDWIGVELEDCDGADVLELFGGRWDTDTDGSPTLDARTALEGLDADACLALPGARWDDEVLGADGEPDPIELDKLDAVPDRLECQRWAGWHADRNGHDVFDRRDEDRWTVGHYARAEYRCRCGARVVVNVRPAPGAPRTDRYYGSALEGKCPMGGGA